jgi:hypothetical protein
MPIPIFVNLRVAAKPSYSGFSRINPGHRACELSDQASCSIPQHWKSRFLLSPNSHGCGFLSMHLLLINCLNDWLKQKSD